jgi:hypothetical protein
MRPLLAQSICDPPCSRLSAPSDSPRSFAHLVGLIDRQLTHYVSFVLAKDSMKQYIVEFAHPTGPVTLIAASVRARSIKSAILIVHDRLREIVAKQSPPKVREYSAEIDEIAASVLCSAFRTVTDNNQEKLAVLISALDQYLPALATRIGELLNANN